VLLNLATLTGFTIINCVIGGQTLSAVNPGDVSVNVGIVITAVIALVICFFGYGILHQYERYAWIPTLISIIIAAGCGGKELANQVAPPAANVAAVLSFAGLVSGFLISWAALSSDFCTYLSPRTHS
jgi:purine-cytosine permease-like protein